MTPSSRFGHRLPCGLEIRRREGPAQNGYGYRTPNQAAWTKAASNPSGVLYGQREPPKRAPVVNGGGARVVAGDLNPLDRYRVFAVEGVVEFHAEIAIEGFLPRCGNKFTLLRGQCSDKHEE